MKKVYIVFIAISLMCVCSEGTWSQVGGDINGEAAFNPPGHAVFPSADVALLAIGSTGNNLGAGRVWQSRFTFSGWKASRSWCSIQ